MILRCVSDNHSLCVCVFFFPSSSMVALAVISESIRLISLTLAHVVAYHRVT